MVVTIVRAWEFVVPIVVRTILTAVAIRTVGGMQVVGIAGLNGKCWVPGTEFNMNSKQPFAVTIQFINGDGLDVGAITADRQFYTQIGQTIEHR